MSENVNKTILLEESDLVRFNPDCLICGGQARKSAGLLQKTPKIELLHCLECGLISASRMPTEVTLSKFYEQYYQQDFYQNRKERVAVIAPRRLAHHIFRSIGRGLRKQKIHILDFGGGDGSVAVELGKFLLAGQYSKNVEITVIDYNTDSVPQSLPESISLSKRSTLDPSLTNTVDIILASAVLEHLVDPKKAFENLLSYLNPGGLFYARTPYIVPLRQLLLLLGMTLDFTYPAHLHDMGSFFWNRILITLQIGDRFELIVSRPSFVETLFTTNFFRTMAAYILKAPWYVVGDIWPFTGGWEVVIRCR